jgi:hypothetical protein
VLDILRATKVPYEKFNKIFYLSEIVELLESIWEEE